MLPKIIHQIWIGPLAPPIEWIDTWRDAHPDWEHRLWTEADFDFPLTCLRQVLLSPTYAGMADILRYEVLQRFGGVYLDADSVCLRPIDEPLLKMNFLIAYENEDVRPGLVANGVMGCGPDHEVLNDLVDSIAMLTPEQMSGFAFVVTGPELITRVITRHEYVDVMPSHLFYPYHFTGERCTEEQLEEAYAVQVWGSTDYDSDVIKTVRKKYGYRQRAYCGGRRVEQMPAILNAVVKQKVKYELLRKEEGYFLAGDNNFRGYKLNEAAAVVWELSCAELPTSEIISLLSSVYPANSEAIQHDVYEVVCEFIRKGFVEVSWAGQ